MFCAERIRKIPSAEHPSVKKDVVHEVNGESGRPYSSGRTSESHNVVRNLSVGHGSSLLFANKLNNY